MSEALKAAAVADEVLARVVFSTAHRYKGKEAPVVRLAGDFPEFCGFNRKTRRHEFRFEEANVAYVAITRAEQVLDLEEYLPTLLASIENRKTLCGSARDHGV